MPNAAESIGTFRNRVTLQAETQTPDGQGGFTSTWNDLTDVWVSIQPVKAYERFQAMQMQTPVTHKIGMRYNPDVTTACRFMFGDRIFWIQEVINVEERNRFLQIRAVERA